MVGACRFVGKDVSFYFGVVCAFVCIWEGVCMVRVYGVREGGVWGM